MKHTMHVTLKARQQGVALFTALMLLLIVTIIGISSVRTGVMEAQMSTNEELRIAAFQTTESILNAVFADSDANFEVIGDIGRQICTDNWPLNSDNSDPCTARSIVLPGTLAATVADPDQLMVSIIRTPPDCVPCPFTTIASSGGVVIGSGSGNHCAKFRVDARYDGTTTGQGRTEILEGVLIFAPGCA